VIGLEIEFTVTVTGPVPFIALLGTVATIWEPVQLPIDVAATPLKATVPWVLPKFDPAIVTCVPIVPTIGVIPVMKGVAPTTTVTLSKVAVTGVP
jgi:hypothetical protein